MNIPFVIDLVLYIPAVISAGYVCVFALAAFIYNIIRRKNKENRIESQPMPSYLFLLPAYGEDNVIVQSVKKALAIDYPKELIHVTVISDHMSDATNESLAKLPVTLLIADYDNSTKAKALQLAMRTTTFPSDYVVILDADNHVDADFLWKVNGQMKLRKGQLPTAIQCHRTAKNTNTSTAMLDAASEEINNSVFRLGHKALGLSSALIGSGMCIRRDWFETHVNSIQTAGEDKEFERMLLAERHKIQYLPDVYVFDEKVQNKANFSRQRLRWLSAQLYSALDMARHLHLSVDYLDKFLQQCLIPRSLLLAYLVFMSLLTLSMHWIALFGVLCLCLVISVPSRLCNRQMLKALAQIPGHTLSFALNLFHIKGQKNKFHHTTHES